MGALSTRQGPAVLSVAAVGGTHLWQPAAVAASSRSREWLCETRAVGESPHAEAGRKPPEIWPMGAHWACRGQPPHNARPISFQAIESFRSTCRTRRPYRPLL